MSNQGILSLAIETFSASKNLAEKAIAQLKQEELFFQPDPESNSIAIIMNHLAGNMISRWTDFLTSDGEKPNRNRDSEFEQGDLTYDQLIEHWNQGWKVLFDTLHSLNEDDLSKTVYIRKEAHTVITAIFRQLSHYSYHVGQIVYLAKHIKEKNWQTLSIPKGKSNEYSPFNK